MWHLYEPLIAFLAFALAALAPGSLGIELQKLAWSNGLAFDKMGYFASTKDRNPVAEIETAGQIMSDHEYGAPFFRFTS